MARTLPPIQAIRAEIDALFAEGRDLVEVIEDVARLGARLIIQTAVEAEVEAFLGRARYQRAAAVTSDDEQKTAVRPGYRNGHCPTTVKTTSGPVTIARPKLRGTTEAFASRLFGTGVTRTNALETLVIASFVRGLSVRDVEGALADALGPEAALSKSTVSTICHAIVAEYDAWCRRELSGIELDYLFLDASHFKMHDGQRAEPVLAAWGITCDGKPVFVGLSAAAAESTDAWHDFLTDLAGRGLRPPLLVISDGAPGLISAAEQVLPASLRQRCVIHKCRNVLSKVSAGDQAEVKAAYWDIFDTSSLGEETEPGQALVEWVQRRIDAFADTWGARYPAAVKSLLADRASLTAYLRFPPEHHKRIRHSNFIERTFGETRRRVKVIGRFPGETSCVSLVWAVLDRAARGWRGFTSTSKGLRTLQDLRRALLSPPTSLRSTATSATDSTPETAAA
ncbi:IS256 family transposase [Nonomuraea sp. NPDC005650]|uniref:IS256 family transposase n=1 Tax=Nonomuraea sp. NPDC005650 TaxID=3157045 RepID=UPI0033A129CF